MVNIVNDRKTVKIPGRDRVQAWTTPTWCGPRFAFAFPVMVERSIETVRILHSKIEWNRVETDQNIGVD